VAYSELASAARTFSDVGLVVAPAGVTSRRPPQIPPTIRVIGTVRL
jgi:hypothetical protein